MRLGDTAPDFVAPTTHDRINPPNFHKWIGDNHWCILFSHPADFTPVCTTELAQLVRMQEEFANRKCRLMGLSTNGLQEHDKWIADIEGQAGGLQLNFPIIADVDRHVATLYGMLDLNDPTNTDPQGMPLTVRTVFWIDPRKRIRATMTYPAAVGRHFDEVLRCLDALQLADLHPIATPANWQPRQPVIIRYDVGEEEANRLFPNHTAPLPYLRYTQINSDDQ